MKKIKNIANSYKTQISTDYKKLTPRDFNKVLMKIINLATLFYTAVLSSDWEWQREKEKYTHDCIQMKKCELLREVLENMKEEIQKRTEV